MQPQVQSLDQILAELDPAYAPQRALYQQQQQALPGQQTAAMTGLDTAKGNAFRDVNTNANSKGLAFSGIPAAEQTRYLGEKYLPAKANLESDFQKQNLTLAQSLAQLSAEQRLKAVDKHDTQQSSLDKYLEAERQRQFEATQNQLNRNASAAGRVASGPSAVEKKQADVGAAHSFLQSVVGNDNRVSPTSYAQAKALWTSLGYAGTEFDNAFADYRNPNNPYYKLDMAPGKP